VYPKCIQSDRFPHAERLLFGGIFIVSMSRPIRPSLIIGILLRGARKQAGLTQLQVADKMGCFKGRIRRLEKGLVIPELDTIQNFAKACGKDFIMVLATENDKKIINRLNQ